MQDFITTEQLFATCGYKDSEFYEQPKQIRSDSEEMSLLRSSPPTWVLEAYGMDLQVTSHFRVFDKVVRIYDLDSCPPCNLAKCPSFVP